MLDVNKFKRIFEDCKNLTIDDYSELVFNTDNKEKVEFYIAIHNFFLQTKQKEFVTQGGY